MAHHRFPKQIGEGNYQEGYLATARILCGDFNLVPDSAHYRFMVQSDWTDAWQQCHADQAHLPTCGIFDSSQWSEGPHCRDYFWLSHELASRIANMSVDTEADLSDHQPIFLEVDV